MPSRPMDHERLDGIVARAQKQRVERDQGYREQALRLFPWVCGRCQRSFERSNLSELTVHHRDHDHNNNPPDGSNWELLCLYCHDNEHSRGLDGAASGPSGEAAPERATHKALAGLGKLLGDDDS